MSDPNGVPDEDTTADPIEFSQLIDTHDLEEVEGFPARHMKARPGWGTPRMKTD